ncbi:MAG: hypothetical protein ACTINV_12400, partial [Cellulosimicrobium funkei]
MVAVMFGVVVVAGVVLLGLRHTFGAPLPADAAGSLGAPDPAVGVPAASADLPDAPVGATLPSADAPHDGAVSATDAPHDAAALAGATAPTTHRA